LDIAHASGHITAIQATGDLAGPEPSTLPGWGTLLETGGGPQEESELSNVL